MQFFNNAPLLFYALAAVVGVECAIQQSGWVWLFLPLLGLPYVCNKKVLRPLFGTLIAGGAYALTLISYYYTPVPEEGVEGVAWITIDQKSKAQVGHSKNWIYQGRIRQFFGEVELKNVPFYMSLPIRKDLPPEADQDYLVQGVIQPGYGQRVILKVNPYMSWEPIGNYSFAEKRFQAKQTIKEWIMHHYSSTPVALFLSGLITGEFDDHEIKRDFGRLGLLHLLAISGFHFAIFVTFPWTNATFK
jgi:competence protein ComEC